jgi:hypothetical protein
LFPSSAARKWMLMTIVKTVKRICQLIVWMPPISILTKKITKFISTSWVTLEKREDYFFFSFNWRQHFAFCPHGVGKNPVRRKKEAPYCLVFSTMAQPNMSHQTMKQKKPYDWHAFFLLKKTACRLLLLYVLLMLLLWNHFEYYKRFCWLSTRETWQQYFNVQFCLFSLDWSIFNRKCPTRMGNFPSQEGTIGVEKIKDQYVLIIA